MNGIGIGKKLRRLREKFGYTQQHMANILNVDRSTYSYYESEKTSPDVSTLITLAKVFNVGIEELLGHEQPATSLYDVKHGTGKGKDITSNDSFIYNLARDEKQFMAFYRAVSPQTKTEILRLMQEDMHRQRMQRKRKKNKTKPR